MPAMRGQPCRIRTLGQRQETRGSSQTLADSARPGKPLDAEYPVDIVRHRYVLRGDTTFGVCHQRESHRPPTNINVGVMILGFGVLAHPAYSVDTGKECGKLDRPAQCAVRSLPAVEVRQRGVHLFIG